MATREQEAKKLCNILEHRIVLAMHEEYLYSDENDEGRRTRMTDRDIQLSRLYEVKRLMAEKRELRGKISTAEKNIGEINKRIENAYYEELPTDARDKLYADIKDRAYNKEDSAKKVFIAACSIAAMIFLAFLILKMSAVGFTDSIPFLAGFVVSVVLAIVGLYREWSLTFLGILVIIALVCVVKFFSQIGWIYLLILVAGCGVAWLIYIIIDSVNYEASIQLSERENIMAAHRKDEVNRKENCDRQDTARETVRAASARELAQIREEIKQSEEQIRNVDRKFAAINVISTNDLPHIDYLIDRIASNRADSVKEALQQLDDKLDKQERERREAARRDFDRFLEDERRRMEQERQERDMENWRSEQRRREEREFKRREEHRKNVENTLDEISKKLDD